MTDQVTGVLPSATDSLDPLGDVEKSKSKNRAKVGSARPSSLLYTYGSGSIMDLPSFSVMPAGLDDWEPIWKRREEIDRIFEPRLLNVVRKYRGNQVRELRPFPWQPKKGPTSTEGSDLGVPARVFPQWLRCTHCHYLGPLSRFDYKNTHPFRPDLAQFTHKCAASGKRSGWPAVPAQHLLTCTNGHLDEFPYTLWVHRGKKCPNSEGEPDLKMFDANVGKSVGSSIKCQACDARRGMAEAMGAAGREKIPQVCRGRHPHLGEFFPGCEAKPALIMMGASNLWFPVTQSIIVMPRSDAERKEVLADRLRVELNVDDLRTFSDQIPVIRALAGARNIDVTELADEDIATIVAKALAPPAAEEASEDNHADRDPIELLVPEWLYLQQPISFPEQQDNAGLMVTEMTRGRDLNPLIDRVVGVNKMKKANAVLGFTRLDEMDRISDLPSRVVPLTRNASPTWVPATEDRGEGIFLQLDLDAVEEWERGIDDQPIPLWTAHKEAHRRNFARRFSETAAEIEPDDRLPDPRYWLLHTFSHILIREMAMHSGYGAASLTERIYAWKATPEREAAAGLLICTTASDSDGTLGGLVALSEPDKLQGIVRAALRRAARCSSDPMCAQRTPSDPEDFLHGAACHTCCFVSETSCEKANRFLDRRFVLDLPAQNRFTAPGFFGSIYGL